MRKDDVRKREKKLKRREKGREKGRGKEDIRGDLPRLNVLGQSLIERLRNHCQLILLVRCFSETLHVGRFHDRLTKRDDWISDFDLINDQTICGHQEDLTSRSPLFLWNIPPCPHTYCGDHSTHNSGKAHQFLNVRKEN
jgi:hypothetical protein